MYSTTLEQDSKHFAAYNLVSGEPHLRLHVVSAAALLAAAIAAFVVAVVGRP